MNAENLLLLEELIRLAQTQTKLSDDELDELKARFLLITSCSPDTLAEIDRIGYEPVSEDEDRPNTGVRSGLTLAGSRVLLTDVIEELQELPASALDELSFSHHELRGALTALWAIVRALEWSSYDEQHLARYDPAKARSVLDATMRALGNYRRTGEP